MNSSSTEFLQEITKGLPAFFLDAIDKGVKMVYHWFWEFLLYFLKENWLIVTIILVLVLVVAILRSLVGYWGMLGSVLYNYLYFGILFIVGLIKGPEVFVSEYFELFLMVILYPLCYLAVRFILDSFNLRRHY